MKIVAAVMQHEPDSFSSLPTPCEAFAGAPSLALPATGEAAAYGGTGCPFAAVARHIVPAAGPGACGSDRESFPFTRLERPIYPVDPETTWSRR